MKSDELYFVAPFEVQIRNSDLPDPKPGQVGVKTLCSAISPGTEKLIYRGQFSEGLQDHADWLSSDLNYPFQYGYACVGEIVDLGTGVNSKVLGKKVFCYQPHASYFVTEVENLHFIPSDFSPESACFLANMETSVNLVQDARPLLGESVVVLGQGIVGLMTTALLMEFPLKKLIGADCYEIRRNAAIALGVDQCFDPDAPAFYEKIKSLLPHGADLTIELTGVPGGLNDAIAVTGFNGRIIIGSWYGQQTANLVLGDRFHRSRIKLLTSQVSTISADLSYRWDKSRRFQVVWDAIQRIQPERWVTHQFAFHQARDAYQLLEQSPQEYIQILFTYDRSME
jgi:2-desacetyl-2-hydroxyethyl bacteriochlorophyllide A dehydrogenase